METNLTASVATFRVYKSYEKFPLSTDGARKAQTPPTRKDRMAATPVTEGPLILSRLASNEINYLQVNNFTRAILPRSQIWRVSNNELVIPASFTNYWLITLNGPAKAIAAFDNVMKQLCRYEVCVDSDVFEEDEPEEVQEVPEKALKVPKARQGVDNSTFKDSFNEFKKYDRIASMSNNTVQVKKTTVSHLNSPDVSPENSPESRSISGTSISTLDGNNQDEIVMVTPPTTPPGARPTLTSQTPDSHTTDNTPAETSEKPLAEANENPVVECFTTEILGYPADVEAQAVVKPSETTKSDIGARTENAIISSILHSQSLESRFEPRFSHPLIPISHVSRYYPTNTETCAQKPRLSLRRQELTNIGPSSLHQDVTTVGGYIGLKAVKGLLRKT